MTLSSTSSRQDYTGNDSTAAYNYGFKIFVEDDILVTIIKVSDGSETTLVKTTDYTVSGVGAAAGGTVTLVDAGQEWISASSFLDTGYKLVFRRKLELKQLTSLDNQGTFYAQVHEDNFDRDIMIDQQQQDELDRSLKLSEGIDPADFDATIPGSIVGKTNVTFMTNATGNAIIEGPSATDLVAATSSVVAAAEAARDTAVTSASNAATSASNASTSETNAAGSATAANDSAVAAAASELALTGILDDSALTGVPTAPTAAGGTDTTQVATTEFIYDAIVGSVSQTAGRPTGQIFERGSNANGHFLKFADGTQICWRYDQPFTASGSATASTSWVFPSPFINTANMVQAVPRGGVGGAAWFVYVGNSGTTTGAGFSIADRDGIARTASSALNVFAMGRWY